MPHAGVQASKGATAEQPAPSEMLKRYLLEARQNSSFDARRKAIAAIKTPADVERRQKDLRGVLSGVAGRPARANAAQSAGWSGRLKRDGYRVEKVIFESRPRHHVTSNLYLPDGQGPFAGVLVPCGHSDNGKAAETYQRICILLARHGMAVLCYDPIGQGERFQLLDSGGKPVIRGTTEHTMAGIGALLVGRQLASYRIWDGFRALDYLASRPEVDPNRLGCTGNSGGGTMTAYLMALDDRIKVAAPSCYITSLERLFETIGPQDAEQNITGQVAAGMEHADYITMRAPEADAFVRGHSRLFRHPRELGYVSRGEADLRAAGVWRARRSVRVGRRARIHETEARGNRPMDEPLAAEAGMRLSTSRISRFRRTRSCNARGVGRCSRTFRGRRFLTSIGSESGSCERCARRRWPTNRMAAFRAEVKKRLGLLEWKAARVPVKIEQGEFDDGDAFLRGAGNCPFRSRGPPGWARSRRADCS